MNTGDTLGDAHHPSRPQISFSMFWTELVAGVILLSIVIYYVVIAYGLPAPMNAADLGAGGFPKIVGLATAAAIVAWLIRTVAMRALGRHRTLITVERPVWVVVGAALLFLQAELFEIVGALPIVAASTLLVMLTCGERRPFHLIITPIILVITVYVTFTLALGIQLP